MDKVCVNLRKWWTVYLLCLIYGICIYILNCPDSIYRYYYGSSNTSNYWGWLCDAKLKGVININYPSSLSYSRPDSVCIYGPDFILDWPYLYFPSTGDRVGIVLLKGFDNLLIYIFKNPFDPDETGFSLYSDDEWVAC